MKQIFRVVIFVVSGLFSGFLFLAIAVTSLIIFFVLVHNPAYNLMATLISDISHAIILVLSTVAVLLGLIKTNRLKFQPGMPQTLKIHSEHSTLIASWCFFLA